MNKELKKWGVSVEITGVVGDFGNILAAASAVGTTSFGLVDSTKAFKGGISNVGFGHIRSAIDGFRPALTMVNPTDPFQTMKANWLNGVPKADQKAMAKSLVRLGITPTTAADLAQAAPGVDGTLFAAAAGKVNAGEELTEQEINMLGRFDAFLDARMDAGFERADQLYRNASKFLAGVISIVLSIIGVFIVQQGTPALSDFFLSLLVGLLATPLAPIAKDISSALSTTVAALKSAKG
ncbi:hypothetical protein ELI36_37465 [Rhizobium ruizarguesonis]|uniref:Phage tail tape measure protein n=1 Tax=Rhizobium ruizarguesonis TaxID=2081791 RepID=A0ABY1WY81_9HYPH|nr:hypothetical protein [Rhizobium ruizarguesonis]TAU13168.1 hypothetical protein ELI48_37600 [Rhizobium ruizarguesonis]TAU58435.1 hypothetical protein ELI45_32890 [Rhizobium ruizarguesonis]TAV03193.1 hypothetical protein ELI34_32760 [Rhizobium ruizarguesonis]TAV19125.1 hypothetical protein ELI36_37465 [Rhizobium ruizarguesonis]TAV19812.1 hypothetical protein ELI33_38345 [Rhizobium ruizarguesonis]